jgi:hypothetical protein
MNYANPSPLRLGATGFLEGQSYRVVGRVVVGMEEGGETYYWQEFNLVDRTGLNATLVWEDGEWKLFTLFEPRNPMTVAEAARKRTGETINLDGSPTPITLVDESRVYYIEGTAPEGVEVGDIAHYFNADAGDRMIVASWTGDEIEFYWGVDLDAAEVAHAFGISTRLMPKQPLFKVEHDDEGESTFNAAGKVLLVLFAAVIGFAGYSWWRGRPLPVPKKPPTPAGLATNLPHAVVEWARQGGITDQHEYYGPNKTLVVGGSKTWLLYHPATNPPTLLPVQAAAKRIGESVLIDGRPWRIQDLFLARTQPTSFGFLAGKGTETALVRWTSSDIEFFIGRPVTEEAARVALAP